DGDSGQSLATSAAVAPSTQGLHLVPGRAPVLSAPADGGTLAVGSRVTWTSNGEGTTFVVLDPTDTSEPRYFLLGGEGAVTFPDLSALGVALPHGANYTVFVSRNDTAATVDDLAAHGPYVWQQPWTWGESAEHQVTTQ